MYIKTNICSLPLTGDLTIATSKEVVSFSSKIHTHLYMQGFGYLRNPKGHFSRDVTKFWKFHLKMTNFKLNYTSFEEKK